MDVSSIVTFDLLVRRLRHLSLEKVRRLLRRLWSISVEERIYRMSARDAFLLPDSDLLRKDCDTDLRLFRRVVPGVFAEGLRAEWERRRAAGEHCYTRVEDDVLVSYGWMIERQLHSWLSCVQQGFEFPPNSAVVYDLYTDPKFRQSCYYQVGLAKSVRDAAAVPGTEWIYVTVLAGDRVPRWWVERLGFAYVCSLYYKRLLWKTKKWQS
jgi:hypothetical protein